MHNRQTINTVRQILANADQVGAKIRKTIRTEHDKLADLADKTRHLDVVTADVPGAVLDAIAAGSDPTLDPGVQRAIAGRLIIDSAGGVQMALSNRSSAFVMEHADEIIEAFIEPFDNAAASLAAALERIGMADLGDTQAVLARGGDAAASWAEAQDAERTITLIRNTRQLLGTTTSRYQVDPRYKLLTYAEVPADRFIDEQLGGSELRPSDVLRSGFRLSLATADVYRARVDALISEQFGRPSAEDLTADAWRRQHQMGTVAAQ